LAGADFIPVFCSFSFSFLFDVLPPATFFFVFFFWFLGDKSPIVFRPFVYGFTVPSLLVIRLSSIFRTFWRFLLQIPRRTPSLSFFPLVHVHRFFLFWAFFRAFRTVFFSLSWPGPFMVVMPFTKPHSVYPPPLHTTLPP